MGLGQEVKDFVAGFQATSEVRGRKRDRDLAEKTSEFDMTYKQALLTIQQDELALKKTAASLKGSTGGGGGGGGKGDDGLTPYQRAQLGLSTRRVEMAESKDAAATADKAAKDQEAAAYAAIGETPPRSAPAALPVEEEAYNPEDYPDQYAKGGLVRQRAFATGGLVDEEKPLAPEASPRPMPKPVAAAAPAGALPMPEQAPTAPAPAPTAAAPPAQPPKKVNPQASKVIVMAAGQAADAALREFSKQGSQPPAAVGGDERNGMDVITNKGGLTNKEYGQIIATVDPNGSIPEHLKAAAALGASFSYFKEKGDMKGAVKAAQGVIIHNKMMTQTMGALAENALREGNLEAGCRFLNDACNNFPNGHLIEVTPDENRGLTYRVWDGEKLVQEGNMNINQAYEFSGQAKNGSLYLNEMSSFASQFIPKKDDEGGSWFGGAEPAPTRPAIPEDAASAAPVASAPAAPAKPTPRQTALAKPAASALPAAAPAAAGQPDDLTPAEKLALGIK